MDKRPYGPGALQPVAEYQPLRIEGVRVDTDPRPPHALLAAKAAAAVLNAFVYDSMLLQGGQPLVPLRARLARRERQDAGEPFGIPGLTYRYPALLTPDVPEFLLFSKRQLEVASLRPAGGVALACAFRLYDVFKATPFWNDEERAFYSGPSSMKISDLVALIHDSGALRPEAPLTPASIADYAGQLGSIALLHTTGATDVGASSIYRSPKDYRFTPRAHTFVFALPTQTGPIQTTPS